MADIVTFVKPSIATYNSGRGVTGANMQGQYQVIPEKLNRNVVVAQSGSLDTRFDDPTFYTA